MDEKILHRLKEAVGAEWATDDPVVLTCYSRDFTPTPGQRPNAVVLPSTTEEVQKVVRIAREHTVPLYTMTTGFNHGGCCIPRHGGILVDLKRMEKLLDVDEESMTVTLQPHVRIAAIYAETEKKSAIDGVSLRPANPITMGSVSLLSNYVSGGASHMAYKGGNHHENIVSMTWVLPDGEILRTGSRAYPVLGDVPVLGPGPDMGGMFLAAEGNFGICTEITIKLFPQHRFEKLFMLMPRDWKKDSEEKYALDEICEFYYTLSRENVIHDIYKSHSRMAACYSGPNVEDLVEGQPTHNVTVTITGNTEEELRIREERFLEIVEKGPMEAVPDFVMETMFGAFGMTMDTAIHSMYKRCYSIGRSMRWKGSFQWVAFPVKFEKIPDMEREFRKIVKRYWVDHSRDGDLQRLDKAAFGTAFQGPFPLGRFVAFEFDFHLDQGNPEDVKRFELVFRKSMEMMADKGAMVGRVVPGSHEVMMPRLGTYAELVSQLKKTMDPDGYLAPDVIPFSSDISSPGGRG